MSSNSGSGGSGGGGSGGSSASSSSTAIAGGKSAPHVLMKKGKRGAAAYIHAACSTAATAPAAAAQTDASAGQPPPTGQHLNDLLDILLNPRESITEWETIEWCKWLMAGGRTPDEFTSIVRTYDNATTCGLVWTPNFVAYRCRTCGISPCMSLCTECFKKGNHHRHDFNMFLSQAGGACDCGDTSVMKETGFCDRHGPNKTVNKNAAPQDLMCVAEAMMPRIILRLIQHMRENSKNPSPDAHKVAIRDAEAYITMLLDFNNMGALMRRVMTSALTNPQQYRLLTQIPDVAEVTTDQYNYLVESKRLYDEAVNSLPNPEPPDEYAHCAPLQQQLVHKTFLEELVFWTVKFEFPQKVVCLLLNMLPDPDYKEDLTRAFVLHYSRIAQMLERSADPDTLSNRVVHVSVQLFSNEALALRMADEMQLLHVMVVSLRHMMSKILVQNTLHDADKNFHLAVDCAQRVMKDHCYWPLVSDLNNVLSHRPIANRFMGDDALIEMWFTFLQMFQGMNVNWRELTQHIEFEPNTYYAAFSAELEASAYPMWALASHLIDENTAPLTRRVVAACVSALLEWLDAVCFTGSQCDDGLRVSFHLPLHRYLAVFVCQAVRLQNLTPDELLPSPEQLQLIMMHPLRVQVAFYEILNGLWVRNGLQIKGQAMTYIQCNFCNSMVDADLYLLQLCSTRVPRDWFLNTVIDKFGARALLTLAPTNSSNHVDSNSSNSENNTNQSSPGIFTNGPQPMLDSLLTFLATLLAVRTNLGLSDLELNRLEMVTLLCMGDKTHSQLMELMPERCGTSQSRDFEQLLASVADYRAPNLEASGNMQQGMYAPKQEVWKNRYDPLHVLLRSVHRRDFQTSMDRYAEWARQSGRTRTGGAPPWPPYRRPAPCAPQYQDPCELLDSKVFHACALAVLMKSARGNASEHATSLIIHLLELAVERAREKTKSIEKSNAIQTNRTETNERVVNDNELASWFDDDCLSINLRTTISYTILIPETPDRSPITYSSSDSDVEWENSDSSDSETNSPNATTSEDLRALLGPPEPTGMEIAIAEPLMDDFSLVATMDVEQAEEATPAILPPTQRPAVLAGNEVGRPATLTEDFTETFTVRPIQINKSTTRTKRKAKPVEPKEQEKQKVAVNESIISLLLRLHSQLSGVPDSYDPDSEFDKMDDSRCGDGPYHVARVLHLIQELDESCKEHLRDCRRKIWPIRPDTEKEQRRRESLEREDRRRRAKERQQRLMEEFANKQRQFLETMETDTHEEEPMEFEEPQTCSASYDCVICGQTTTSTEDKPMGLVVLVQATSVLGHRRRVTDATSEEEDSRPPLPTSPEERAELNRYTTMSSDFSKRFEELDRHFDRNTHDSWLLALNIGWEGGVHVQTCGHHLHLDCLRSYLESLRTQQRLQSLAVDKGEYFCPLCRQLANSVLPLPPELGTQKAAIVRARTAQTRNVTETDGLELRSAAEELRDMLRDTRPQPPGANLGKAIGKAMEDMTNSTHMKTLPGQQSPMSLYLFIASIARTNLEVELVQRGGTLVSNTTTTTSELPSTSTQQIPIVLTPKRDCIVPLLHVLAVHVRLVAQWSHWVTWEQLYGSITEEIPFQSRLAVMGPTDVETASSNSNATTNATACVPSAQSSRWGENPTPLLYRDPVALLIKFTLLLPLHMDQMYFTTVVRLLYNLLYYQVVAQLTTAMTNAERASIKDMKKCGLVLALSRVIETLSGTDIYGAEDASLDSKVNINALEQRVQQLCLPFLRVAALLRHHLYGQPLPEVRAAECEFVRIVYYLELVTDGMDWELFSAAAALRWADSASGEICTNFWLGQLRDFAMRSQIAARSLLSEQHVTWKPPKLLRLPREYEKIFTYYHERQCTQCHSVPPETSVCLLCGRVVCLKHSCCKQGSVCEAVAHSLDCGAGTGLFLVVTSTYVIVIRGRRACLWGSLYLDDFEEEDRDLKRGKPLYLSKDRFQLLEQQWLAHRFDHTKKTWVWHRDAL